MIEQLLLSHFRCFEEAAFSFSSGIHLFWGENGAGKSSILEALTLFIFGQSFRTKKAQHLVEEGFSKAFAKLHYKSSTAIHHQLGWTFDEKGSFYAGQKKLSGASEVLGLIPAVSLTPQDATLITGSPDDRRRFLDLLLAKQDPTYLHHRLRYQKGLECRNENLKNKRVQMLDAIETELEKSALYLISAREQGLQKLLPHADPLFRHLLGAHKKMEFVYKTKTNLRELWKTAREKELDCGYTLNGPHRDDILFHADGREIRHFGSEGEKKSYLLALKLAHHATHEGKPLLLLDDLTASLDPVRIEKFWDIALSLGQVIITSTTPVSHSATHHTEVRKKTTG